jgi:hypothetical protein
MCGEFFKLERLAVKNVKRLKKAKNTWQGSSKTGTFERRVTFVFYGVNETR